MVSEAFEESIIIIQILKLLKPACTQLRGSVRCDVLDEKDVVNEISLLLIGWWQGSHYLSLPKCFKSRYKCLLAKEQRGGVGWGGVGWGVWWGWRWGGGVCFGHISHLRLADWRPDRGAHWTKKWICTKLLKLRGVSRLRKFLRKRIS